MYTVKYEQCKRTNPEILKGIISCCVCNLIPIPVIRDRLNSKNAYCTECAILKKINKIKATNEDRHIFEQLIIDCSRFCGKTFSYDTIDNYLEHDLECDYVINETPIQDICFRCRKQVKESEHDCLLNTNKRITCVEKSMEDNFEFMMNRNEKIFTEIDLKINSKFSKIMDILNENQKEKDELKNQIKSLVLQFDNLKKSSKLNRDVIDEDSLLWTKEIPLRSESQQLNSEFNFNIIDNEKNIAMKSQSNDLFDQIKMLQSETFNLKNNLKVFWESMIDKINTIKSDFKDDLLKFANFIEEEKKFDLDLNNEFMNINEEILNIKIKYRNDMIANLLNELKNMPSLRSPNGKFNSFIKSDILTVNENSFPIDFLNNIDNLLSFQENYQIIKKKIQYYSINPILYGNINYVFENSPGNYRLFKAFGSSESSINSINCLVIKQGFLICCSSDHSIKVWNLNYYSLHKEIKNAHNGELILTLLVYKDLILSGGNDSKIRFWDNNYNQIDCIGNGTFIHHMVISKEILIAGGYDRTINFYDLQSKLLLNKIITDHKFNISRILILKSNETLISGGSDCSIKIWSLGDYTVKGISNSNQSTLTLSFHQGGIESLLQLDFDDNILVSSDSKGSIVFSSIKDNYKIINNYEISLYDKNPNNNYTNFMQIYELKKYKMLVTSTNGSSLLFWNLNNYEIVRNVWINERISSVIELENGEGLIFSQGNSNIVIWK